MKAIITATTDGRSYRASDDLGNAFSGEHDFPAESPWKEIAAIKGHWDGYLGGFDKLYLNGALIEDRTIKEELKPEIEQSLADEALDIFKDERIIIAVVIILILSLLLKR